MIGIYLMGFVILVAGAGALGVAIAYAVRPTEQKLLLMRPLSLASIFAAVCSAALGFSTALRYAAQGKLADAALVDMTYIMGEALIPIAAAFLLLSIAWLLVAARLRV